MTVNEIHLTCKDCPYYSGTHCHGHGEYYGECLLLKPVYRLIKDVNIEDRIHPLDYWLDDDSICIFIKKDGFNNE